MKKWLFAVSLIIIIVGLATTTTAFSFKETKTYPRVAMVSQAWSVNASLNEGDFVWVDIRQGADWPVGLFEIDELYPGFAVLYVGVNITDPQGKSSIFLIIFGRLPESGQAGITPLSILDINLTVNEASINATPLYRPSSNSYWDVGGIAQLNGTYTFTVGNIWPSRDDPPSVIDIRKRIVSMEQPYMYLFPVGIMVTAGGTTLTWFSFRKKKVKKRSKALS